MLNLYAASPQGLNRIETPADYAIPSGAIWIDLLEPTQAEELAVEHALGIDVPTREEMKEIETSNRLYEEDGTLYMTATVAARLDTARPESTAVTFIIANGRLITNRYLDTKPFQRFKSHANRQDGLVTPLGILAGLVEAFVERLADLLERIGNDLDALSGMIFGERVSTQGNGRDLHQLLARIGFNGELDSKARESLVSLGRLLAFLQQTNVLEITHEHRSILKSISRDVTALSDHASFLGSKLSFLLEATLGLVNLEQNNIIKIFSVAAVLFLPPSLVASIYGVNFEFMPELSWVHGYPFALLLMLASMILTWCLFKRKGWL
jgi:magnesium transporter